MEDRKSYVSRKVIELAAEQVSMDPAQVTVDSHFINDLQFDSLDKVEFAMDIEDEFELSVPDADVEDLQTVREVVAYLLSRPERDESEQPSVSSP